RWRLTTSSSRTGRMAKWCVPSRAIRSGWSFPACRVYRASRGWVVWRSEMTSPSGGQVILDRGQHEITGLAWSGRGRVRRVDVSPDGGRNWRTARLQEPVLTKALTRFRIDWTWDGGGALLQSRVIDETGYVQPPYRQLREVRGTRSIYH